MCSFPSTVVFTIGFRPRCNRAHWCPSLSSLPSLQEQRELLQSLRQSAFESESDAPAGTFSTERRRSLCAKEFRKLGFMVRPQPSMFRPQWDLSISHRPAVPLLLGEVLDCVVLCLARTTATQQRTCAVHRRGSSPSTTWCISPGTPPVPTAGCVLLLGESPSRKVLVDLQLLILSFFGPILIGLT